MIGAVSPTRPCIPQLRSKNHHRQQEEGARYLQPQDAADSAEGAQESAHAAREARCSPPGCLTFYPSAHSGGNSMRGGGGVCRSTLRAADHALAGDPPGNP